jgi:hypothetical protein
MMRMVYRVLAYLVAAEVAVQAIVMVFAIAGLGKWVDGGGVFDKAVLEGARESGETPFPEVIGFMIHGINGMLVIPALALLLVISSFFTRVHGAVRWAGLVLLLVLLQVTLGLLGHGIPIVGGLHGLNALLLFGAAFYTGHRVRAFAAPRQAVAPQAPIATSA